MIECGPQHAIELAFAIPAELGGVNEGEKGKNIIGQEWWRDSLNCPGRLSFLLIIKEIGWPDPIL
ncbi:MAG: hypothetical protein PHU81_08720 [Acidobacteriota bacterium]|nr:hypothetical protein [Acidobacteriota bacterium]